MVRVCDFQHTSEALKLGFSPCARRMLTSYKPMAKKGPTNKQPDMADKVYSGLL
jgi:hypothetical protein